MASTSRTKRQRSSRARRDEVVQPVVPANVVAPPELDTYGIQFTFSEQVSRFKNLQGRSIQSTKFCDLRTLNALGIGRSVAALFERIGWHRYLALNAPTYRALTLEFLSTMKIDSSNGIDFRLFNTDHHLTQQKLYKIFSFENNGVLGPKSKFAPYFKDDEFWHEITGLTDGYDSRHAKASMIRHPVMRLAHRILSSTICARSDTGTVTRYELYVLYCMAHRSHINGEYIPDGPKYILDKFSRAQESTSGDICFGGLITLLATSTKLSLQIPDDWKPVTAFLLDISHLHTRVRMIEPVTDDAPTYYWLVGADREHHSVILPSPLTDFTEHTDWLFPDTMQLTNSPSHSSHHSPQHAHSPPLGEQILLPHQLISRLENFTLESREGRRVVANNFNDLNVLIRGLQAEMRTLHASCSLIRENQSNLETHQRSMATDIACIKSWLRCILEHYCSQHNLPLPP